MDAATGQYFFFKDQKERRKGNWTLLKIALLLKVKVVLQLAKGKEKGFALAVFFIQSLDAADSECAMARQQHRSLLLVKILARM